MLFRSNHDDIHNEVQLVEVQQDENEDDFNCLTDSESEDEIGRASCRERV